MTLDGRIALLTHEHHLEPAAWSVQLGEAMSIHILQNYKKLLKDLSPVAFYLFLYLIMQKSKVQ